MTNEINENTYYISAIALLLASATSTYAAAPTKASATSKSNISISAISGISGINAKFIDKSVKAQDDFYRHVSGEWLKNSEIPADRSSAGAFVDLSEAVIPRLHSITESLSKQKTKHGTDAQKIADLYASFMDTAKIEALGLKPLQSDFEKINAITNKKQIPALISYFNLVSVGAPIDIGIHQDNKDSTK